MQLALDVGPVPMQIAAVLLLEPAAGFDLAAAAALLGQRLGRVPRLRQRLVRAPAGCGRPYWIDDGAFDPRRHVHVVACAMPGDEQALLDAALAAAAEPLARTRPLWSATFVTGLADGRTGLVVVVHHVLADGIGGLAVLGELFDAPARSEMPVASGFPLAAPSRRALVADAWATRFQALARAGELRPLLAAAWAELGSGPPRAPRTSLNRPSGSRRAAGVVRGDLAAVVTAAHAQHGTVNDVVLAAVTGALGSLLAGRGETVGRLVVSVPVSARTAASRVDPGNHVGVIPLALPTGGDPLGRLASVVAITRARKLSAPGASAALLEPAFRGLAALHVLGWIIDRQRLVNTFVTNVRGPAAPMTFLGAAVDEIIPISGVNGNATVAFAVLSYAGVLTITVVADPDAVPDLSALTGALQDDLDTLTAITSRRDGSRPRRDTSTGSVDCSACSVRART